MRRCVLVAAVVSCCFSTRALAQAPGPEAGPSVQFLMEAGFTLPTGAGVSAPASLGTGFPVATSTVGNLQLGLDLPASFTVLVGIGIVSAVDSIDIELAGGKISTTQAINASVLDLHLRYYIPRRTSGFSPYAWGEVQKAILWAAVSTDDPLIAPEELQRRIDSELRGRSPLGVLAGVGAEYRFAGAFAAGGRWGLGWWSTSRAEDPADLGQGAVRGSSSHHLIASQARLYGAFRF